jgi:hypothetical protein
VQGVEKLAVVALLAATPRPARLKHAQHNNPILLAPPCQHNRPETDHPSISLGIHNGSVERNLHTTNTKVLVSLTEMSGQPTTVQ